MTRLGVLFILAATAFGAGESIASAEDIALSLVNPKGQIDVPVSAVTRVQPYRKHTFRNTETGEIYQSKFDDSYVEVCFSEDIHKRVCALTQQIVGEPLEIVVGCRTIVKPIVREPLCSSSCFIISIFGFTEANALAQQIRGGTNRQCAPSS